MQFKIINFISKQAKTNEFLLSATQNTLTAHIKMYFVMILIKSCIIDFKPYFS